MRSGAPAGAERISSCRCPIRCRSAANGVTCRYVKGKLAGFRIARDGYSWNGNPATMQTVVFFPALPLAMHLGAFDEIVGTTRPPDRMKVFGSLMCRETKDLYKR